MTWYVFKLDSGKTIGTNDLNAFKGTIFEERIVERSEYNCALKSQIKKKKDE